jgi:hypothetical protein
MAKMTRPKTVLTNEEFKPGRNIRKGACPLLGPIM